MGVDRAPTMAIPRKPGLLPPGSASAVALLGFRDFPMSALMIETLGKNSLRRPRSAVCPSPPTAGPSCRVGSAE